jgi:RNA-directed DNA polymerase
VVDLNEVDAMLERVQEVTRNGRFTYVEYARYADDLVILVDGYRRHDWLLKAVDGRLREEFAKLDLRLNEAKSRIVDLTKGEALASLARIMWRRTFRSTQSFTKRKHRAACPIRSN